MNKQSKIKQSGAPGNKNTKTLSILVSILLATNAFTIIYYNTPKPGSSFRISSTGNEFLDPAHKFYDKKDLIVDIQPLRDELNNIGEKDKDLSVYFEFLSTGANISINKEAEYFPASLLKLPVAMAVAKKIEKGDWKWSNELVLMSSDKDYKFGDLYEQEIGTKFTIESLVEKVLAESDNTANNILMRNLDPEEFFEVYRYLGLGDFFSSEGKISAKNYSVIWRSLYTSSYLTEENSQKIISILTRSPFKEYLESGLPNGITFSHKIGINNEQEVYMDAGIVYAANRPYLLVVMTKTQDIEKAKKIMGEISKKTYDYIANYRFEY